MIIIFDDGLPFIAETDIVADIFRIVTIYDTGEVSRIFYILGIFSIESIVTIDASCKISSLTIFRIDKGICLDG